MSSTTQKTPSSVPMSAIEPKLMIPHDWMHVSAPASQEAAALIIADCREKHREILRRMRSLPASVGRNRRKKLTRQWFHCQSARIGSYVLAIEKRGRTIGEGADQPMQVIENGLSLAPEADRGDTMIIQPADPDPSNEASRTICRFGDWDYARQRQAHDILKALTVLPPELFQYNGGEPAALQWMGRELQNAAVVLTTDFPKCFPLLPWELVENGLLTSRKVTRALLFEPWKRVKVKGFGPWKMGQWYWPAFYGGTTIGPDCAVEIGSGRGIPPGSALSSLVAQAVLHQMLGEDVFKLEGVRFGLWADNLVILLASRELEAPVLDGLAEMAKKHFDNSVMELFLQRTTSHLAGEAFVFLGRRMRVRRGELRLEALPEHNLRIVCRVLDDLASAQKWDDFDKPTRRLIGYAIRHGIAPSAANAVIQGAISIGVTGKSMEKQLSSSFPAYKLFDEI